MRYFEYMKNPTCCLLSKIKIPISSIDIITSSEINVFEVSNTTEIFD